MSECISLKKSNCKNCYKCIRHCPVKSIRFSGNQAHIVADECILCGKCVVVCPQKAKVARDDVEAVKVLLGENEKVVVSLAPSFVAKFPHATIASMERALKKLGFFAVEETAVGASLVKEQYDRLLDEGQYDVLISSCCSSVNLLIRKYFPEALPYLARVLSPMQVHCVMLKEKYPGCKTVFVGPCIAKKAEGDASNGVVDAVLTFDEISRWLESASVEVEPDQDHTTNSKARLFPISGGILRTMECRRKDVSYMAIDGMGNCLNALRDVISGSLSKCFIEMSACSGSCVGGPEMGSRKRALVSDVVAVDRYAGPSDFIHPVLDDEKVHCDHPYMAINAAEPSEAEIAAVLRKMGKSKPEDELNCGSCGYNTCREKAIAVIRGKADLSMCLPFLKDRAESFSNNIINNTPNGIVVLNESLEVQQINEAALSLMNIRRAADVLGEGVDRILDPKPFREVKDTGKSAMHMRSYLADYGRYVEQSIVFDSGYHVLICIVRDVSDEEAEREQKERISRHTIEITDQVVEKQMRVVQEIASLLGETTAETKIALTQLKESLRDESSLH